MYKNLGIRTKYLLPALLTTVGFLVVIVYGVKTLNSNADTFVSFIDRDQTLLLSLNDMYAQGLQSEQATRNILLNPKDDKAKANYGTANEEFASELTRARNAAFGKSDVLAQLDVVSQKWQALDALKSQVQQLAVSGNASRGVELLTSTETSSWREVRADLLALIRDAEKSSQTNKASVQEGTHDAIVNVATFSIAIVLLSLLLILLSANAFVKPIHVLEENANKVAAGDTDVRVAVKSNDEVGRLSKSFNTMVESIRNSLNEVNEKNAVAESALGEAEEAKTRAEQQSEYLSKSVDSILLMMGRFADGDLTVQLDTTHDDAIGKLFSGFNKSVATIHQIIGQLRESIETTATAATQISSSTEELAAGVQEQSAQSSEVAAAVEEMTRTIIDNSHHATQAAQVAVENGGMARAGADTVQETTAKMREIAEVVTNSATKVEKLGNSSRQISEIVSVIDDIADQTNLLALNAAIEAARAGEQGKGFAVVADEVRKLAERTTQATKQIEGMIKGIQSDTGEAVDSMKHGTREVEKGLKLADKAAEALEKIVAETKRSVDMINQIAAASEEQSTSSEQISKNVEAISSVANESATGVSQIARSADDLNRLTENLRNLVSRFKIDSSRRYGFDASSVSADQNNNGDRYSLQLATLDFERAKMAHRMWKMRLTNCLSGKGRVDEKTASDYRGCELGKWYFGEGKKLFKNNTAFDELGRWHTELHNRAAEVVGLCNQERREEARKKLHAIDEPSKHIMVLLDELKEMSKSELVTQ